MAVSVRQQHLARRAAAEQAVPVHEYEILDPAHRPDLKGEFAGAKVYQNGGKQCVRLTDRQAQFYLDQGAIKRTNDAPVATTVTTPTAGARKWRGSW